MNAPAVGRTREPAIRRFRGILQPSVLEGAFFPSWFQKAVTRHGLLDRASAVPHLIQPRSWNLTLSCAAISAAVALARPSSPLLPLVSP